MAHTLFRAKLPAAMDVLRINMWSGPRNISTALMYSFAQRGDTRVIDEPLYGHYLRVSGAPHPAAQDVMRAMECDGDTVVQTLMEPWDRPIIFAKQMAHHLVSLNQDFLGETVNVLLVRDPHDMLPSLAKQLKKPDLRDTGYDRQVQLLEELETLGQDPPLEARRLLTDPQPVLSTLCERLGIDFDPNMLTWEPGPIPEDGVWAPHWYHNVHRSTGFQPYQPKPFPADLMPLLDICRPLFDRLAQRAIAA